MNRELQQETYREQLVRLARSLAWARDEEVRADLAPGTAPELVTMFTEGNRDKRFEKIQKQVEFVGDAFDTLDELISDFVVSTAPAAYDTGVDDGEQFLRWLETAHRPTAEQRDYIACQRARHAVEDVARRNRILHIHFQELLSTAESLGAELETNRTLRIHLNPVRAWSQFETRTLLDDGAELPAVVLFYAVGNDVRTALLEPEGIARVREFEEAGDGTLESWWARNRWSGNPVGSSAELAEFCRDLAGIGLVAFS
jgi:hypothetical protein